MAVKSLAKSMGITGGAQIIGILLSIVRNKGIALLLGPTGVGLISLYETLKTTLVTVAGLGLASSMVRSVAQSREEREKLRVLRLTVTIANVAQGTIAAIVVWLFRADLSRWLFGNESYSDEVVLVGLATVLSLTAASQTSILRGLRQVANVGKVTISGAVATTVIGLLSVWYFGIAGAIVITLVQPIALALAGFYFTRRIHSGEQAEFSAQLFWRTWRPLVKLGLSFTGAALSTTLTALLLRQVIGDAISITAIGIFAAAWGISVTYIGFLLSAMGMDYYPRLAEVIDETEKANALINSQAQLGLMVAGPILLLLVGLAPLVIYLLYSAEFSESVAILQWQSAGNLLKIACWPLGFAFIAAARGTSYLITQINFNLIYLALVWFGIDLLGIEVTGIAFLVAYAGNFILQNIMMKMYFDFRWEPRTLFMLGAQCAAMALLLVIALSSAYLGAIIGALMFVIGSIGCCRFLLAEFGRNSRTDPFFSLFERLRWPIKGP